jgi:SAM-dependent methyltransferase
VSVPYDATFFQGNTTKAKSSADIVAPIVHGLIEPGSVIDVGCALGEWAAAFRSLGCDVTGIDGNYVNLGDLLIPRDRFIAADISLPFRPKAEFDLALCLEVAEHLPQERAAGFVADLTILAPVVLFSAAIPHQGGEQHINEQWPEFWRDLFDQRGFAPIDCVRREIWTDPRVRWWYAQNCFLYVRKDALTPALRAADDNLPLRLVHPHLFGYWTSQFDALERRAPWREIASRIWRAIKQRAPRF